MLNASVPVEIEHVVRTMLAPLLVTSVTVAEGQDYDDRDVLYVTVNLAAGTSQLPGDLLLRVMTSASEAVLQLGEQRPPYFRTMREREPEPIDDFAEAPH